MDDDDRRYPKHPLVGVGVVVWRGEEVLLIQRGKPPRLGQWSLPGGLQKLGETVFEAARREVREETRVAIDVLAVVDIVDSVQRDGDDRVKYHYTLIDVVAEWRAGEAQAGDDAAGVVWVGHRDLAGYDLWDETVRIIGLSVAKRGQAS